MRRQQWNLQKSTSSLRRRDGSWKRVRPACKHCTSNCRWKLQSREVRAKFSQKEHVPDFSQCHEKLFMFPEDRNLNTFPDLWIAQWLGWKIYWKTWDESCGQGRWESNSEWTSTASGLHDVQLGQAGKGRDPAAWFLYMELLVSDALCHCFFASSTSDCKERTSPWENTQMYWVVSSGKWERSDATADKDKLSVTDSTKTNVTKCFVKSSWKWLVPQGCTISFLQLREEAFQLSREEHKTAHHRTTTSAQETALTVDAHGVTTDQMSQVLLKALQEHQQSLQN